MESVGKSVAENMVLNSVPAVCITNRNVSLVSSRIASYWL